MRPKKAVPDLAKTAALMLEVWADLSTNGQLTENDLLNLFEEYNFPWEPATAAQMLEPGVLTNLKDYKESEDYKVVERIDSKAAMNTAIEQAFLRGPSIFVNSYVVDGPDGALEIEDCEPAEEKQDNQETKSIDLKLFSKIFGATKIQVDSDGNYIR